MSLEDFEKQDAEFIASERVQAAKASRLERELVDLRRVLRLRERIDAARVSEPEWLLNPTPDSETEKVTACLTLADLHYFEVINPAEVGGYNAYNAEIASMRLKELARRTIKLTRHYISGVDIEGMCLFMVGDNIAGLIHEELKETNEGTVMEAIVSLVPQLAAFIRAMADEFGKVHVPCVTGNHDRNSRKPRSKQRAQDSFDWVIYHWLANHFQDDDRVTFQISEAADARVQVQNTRFLLTHGDQFRGGSGIAGLLSPLMIGLNRKTRRELAMGHTFDWMVMGHWHQFFAGKGIISSGALVGYSEYNYVNNHEPEPPSQAFWVVSPKYGVTLQMPVFPCDPVKEGWREEE